MFERSGLYIAKSDDLVHWQQAFCSWSESRKNPEYKCVHIHHAASWPFEVWSYLLDVMKITPLIQTCVLNQIYHISPLPPSESLLGFSESCCSWLIVLTHQNNLENFTLSHRSTHCNCYKRKQNNWKLLIHIKYWRVSLVFIWGSLHKQINLLTHDWHALLAT